MRRKRSRHNSILSKLTLFLAAILAFQCFLFAGFILLGGTVDRLEENAMAILNERTLNRKNYLEGEMVQRWSVMEQAQTDIGALVAERLAENGMDYADLQPNSEETASLLVTLSEPLISLMRRNSVTGAFLIFQGDASLERPMDGAESIQTGVYFRDLDPRSSPADNSDLMVERGPTELLRALKIPMDINWNPTFILDELDDCYYAPMQAAAANPGISVQDLGRWSGPIILHGDNVSVITYTQPLLAPDGTPYGVVGVELTADYLRSLLPYRELNSDKTAAYLLAVTRPNSPDDYQEVITSGPMAQRIFSNAQNVSLESEAVFQDVYLVDQDSNHISDNVYGSVQSIKLYNTNTPFEEQQWVLIGLVEQQELFSFSHAVSVSVVWLVLFCLVLGTVLALLAVTLFTRPIRTLSSTVRQLDPSRPVWLPPTHIMEIDDLSSAIESLSHNVAEASSRLSTIVELAGIPLAAYQLGDDMSWPYYTKDFFPLLGRAEPDHRVTKAEFSALLQELDQYIEEGESGGSPLLYCLPTPAGGKRWLKLQTVHSGNSVLGVLVDSTEEVVERRRIEFERDYDLLTSLLNRRSFLARLRRLESHPEQLRVAAMLMMDLDNLKYLNDTYGHDCGDEYIRCAADVLRRFTAFGGLASRISGDEFYLFLSGYDSKEDLQSVLRHLQEEMAQAYIRLHDGQVMKLRASMGIAWYPDDSTSLAELQRYADFAMYEAKSAMKGTVKHFDIHTYQRDSFLLYSQEELNRILEEEAIDYVFQPIVDVRTGEILALEALMRPRSKALPTPLDFLRIARAQSKLQQVERLTWFKAMEAFVTLPEREEHTLLFANSLPSQRLTPDDLVEFDRRFGGHLDKIVIELTEGDELDPEATASKRDRVERLHTGIAIDDFGTGYSNDSVLLSVDPDFVKVDMTIIHGIESDRTRQALFSNLVDLCRKMKVKIIAEGVETEAEARTVIHLGADYIQGYYTGKPAAHPAPINEEVLAVLRSASEETAV